MENVSYINILKDILTKKMIYLDNLLEETNNQERCLLEEEVDIEELEKCIFRKSSIIEQLEQLDDGFELIYDRVATLFKNDKQRYKNEIIQLQELIKNITHKSTVIQGMETKNKNQFENYLSKRKMEIKNYKLSNNMITNYYKSMSDGYHGGSFFLDKKK